MSDDPSRTGEDSDPSRERTLRVPGHLPLAQPTLDPRGSDVTIQVKPSEGSARTIAAPSSPPPAPAPAVPSSFRYRVVDLLGRGGMGRVELAIDPSLGREVAIKTILAPDDASLRGRFLEEARVAGQLEHPNIIPIHELGHDDHRGPYLVMKRIRGRSLKDVLAAIPGSPSPERTLADLLHAFIKVCEAMAYAHARGVIHRDLKPDNIMIGEFGEVVVMDWGLAKVLGNGEAAKVPPIVPEGRPGGSTSRTIAGDVLGTPLYMSPEQARGEVGTLDARADVYSLGATLYEILTLNSAFDATGVNELLGEVAAGHVLPPRKRHKAPWPLPRELEAAALKAMARDREARYPTATALKEDVEAWFAGRRLSAVEYSPWEVLAKFARRHRTLLATGATAFIVLAIATVLFVVGLRASRDEAEAARKVAVIEKRNAQDQEREARRRFANGLVAQGEAFLMAGQTLDARLRYEESLAEFAAIREESMAPLWGIAQAMRVSPPPLLEVRGWNGPLSYVAISPDGRRFVTGGPKDPPTLCESATGRRIRVFDGGATTTVFAGFASHARLVTAHCDGTIHVHETETGTEVLAFKAHDESFQMFAMRRDGGAFLTADRSLGSPIRVWDIETGSMLRQIEEGQQLYNDGDISPDGRRVAVGGWSSHTRLHALDGGPPLTILDGHQSSIQSIAWSPDGGQILTTSSDGTARLWNAETGVQAQLFQPSPGSTESVTCGAFGATGRQIFLEGPSGTAFELNSEVPERMRDLARRVQAAMARLTDAPNDADALATLGEWHAFRGAWDWAADLLERARVAGATIDRRLLVTAYWRIDRVEEARRVLAPMREARELSRFEVSLILAGLGHAEALPRELAAVFVDPRPIEPGKHKGSLSSRSPRLSGRAIESFRLSAIEGERVTIRVRAEGFDPLVLVGPPHQGIQRIRPQDEGDQVFTFHEAGDYLFGCTSAEPGGEGSFELELVVE